MARHTVIDLARSGRPDAIAFLLNRALRPYQTRAQVGLRGSQLWITLQAMPLPEPQLAALIMGQLQRLEIPRIQTVRITAQQSKDAHPGWSETFELPISSGFLDQRPGVPGPPQFAIPAVTPLATPSKRRTVNQPREQTDFLPPDAVSSAIGLDQLSGRHLSFNEPESYASASNNGKHGSFYSTIESIVQSQAMATSLNHIHTATVAGLLFAIAPVLSAAAGRIYSVVFKHDAGFSSLLPTPLLALHLVGVIALSYGIFCKNQICAGLMLLYALLSIYIGVRANSLPIVPIIVAFLALQAFQAISSYRRLH